MGVWESDNSTPHTSYPQSPCLGSIHKKKKKIHINGWYCHDLRINQQQTNAYSIIHFLKQNKKKEKNQKENEIRILPTLGGEEAKGVEGGKEARPRRRHRRCPASPFLVGIGPGYGDLRV